MTNSSAESIESLIESLVQGAIQAQSATGPGLRQLHPKSHGLVYAEFIVQPHLPTELRAGVFAQERSYPSWVRFSNGAGAEKRGQLKTDQSPDVRGLAVKLMEVAGEKLLDEERETQDFVMVSAPFFFVANVRQYVDFFAAAFGKPSPELLAAMAPNFKLAEQMTGAGIQPLQSLTYWSTTAYKHGEVVVKFLVKPQSNWAGGAKFQAQSENCLREDLVEYLTEGGKEIVFDFYVQKYVDDKVTPIDDPTIEWKEEDAPPIKLAVLKIPAQQFDFEERKTLDLAMAFNPWHSLAAHEPLGEVNLARKLVYLATTKHRRDYMSKLMAEPVPHNKLKDDPVQ